MFKLHVTARSVLLLLLIIPRYKNTLQNTVVEYLEKLRHSRLLQRPLCPLLKLSGPAKVNQPKRVLPPVFRILASSSLVPWPIKRSPLA